LFEPVIISNVKLNLKKRETIKYYFSTINFFESVGNYIVQSKICLIKYIRQENVKYIEKPCFCYIYFFKSLLIENLNKYNKLT